MEAGDIVWKTRKSRLEEIARPIREYCSSVEEEAMDRFDYTCGRSNTVQCDAYMDHVLEEEYEQLRSLKMALQEETDVSSQQKKRESDATAKDWISLGGAPAGINSSNNMESLQKAWAKTNSNKTFIASEVRDRVVKVLNLAISHGCTEGKWIYFADAVSWNSLSQVLQEAAESGVFGTAYVKINSTCHGIQVWTSDFTDKKCVMTAFEVLSFVLGLAGCRVKSSLTYKPEVYSLLGIYIKTIHGTFAQPCTNARSLIAVCKFGASSNGRIPPISKLLKARLFLLRTLGGCLRCLRGTRSHLSAHRTRKSG